MTIIVINLDVCKKYKENILNYLELTALEKIHLIKNRIIAICKRLEEDPQYKNKKWIIAWREHGITDKQTKDISTQTKKTLKETFSSLTQTYPQLSIIAGTVKTRKKIPVTQLKDISSYYKKLTFIAEKEKKLGKRDEQILFHHTQITRLISTYSQNSHPPTATIDVLRNTCYIFEGKEIKRHDKMAPFKEINERKNEIFKPGGKENKNIHRFIKMVDPSNNQNFDIALEICREHLHHLAKKEQDELKINPSIHFILSDSIRLVHEGMIGKYVIHLDSFEKPSLILTEDIPEAKQDVIFFNNSLFYQCSQLTRVNAYYPFMLNALNRTQIALNDPLLSSSQTSLLIDFKNNILKKNENLFLTFLEYSTFTKKIKALEESLKTAPFNKKTDMSNLYHSGEWTSVLLKLLKKSYKTETECFYKNPFLPLKHSLLVELDNYSASRLSSSKKSITNLQKEELSLIESLKEDIDKTENLFTLKALISRYKIISHLYNGTFFKKHTLENHMENIEKNILTPYGSSKISVG